MKEEERHRRAKEDAALVKLAIDGDEKAYKSLIRRYKNPVAQVVYRLVKDRSQVEDLTQEVFIKAFQHLQDFDYEHQFASWLFKIANNHCIDYIRKKKLRVYSIDEQIQTEDGKMDYEIPDSTYEPDLNILREQKSKLIRQAINSLPDKYREVIVLRHQEELSYEEIAVQTGLPVNTIKVHLFRAREMLYKFLKDKIKHY
ncbi:MAG: sigma-70 family RNA polymerase sigma factor [Bacteroidetes bacterium]|jgi:RNA polymerase sigma-70 factor (ECF subfamily)|nr:sigma-70 family RNA polymerase sigma factor [Bacteroidota bacterium]